MSTERIVGVLIKAPETYVFQQRDDISGIVNPGMVSVFSGAMEAGDANALAAAHRELSEETDIETDMEQIKRIAVMRYEFEEITYEYIMHEYSISSDKFKIYEGQGAYKVPHDFNVHEHNLTAVTRDFLFHYLKQWGIREE